MSLDPIVYVVDDDASVRGAVSRLLRSDGLAVESFETAQAFLEHPRSDAPSCLLLDVQLPGQSGIELQRELSAQGVDVPIVFMSGHGDIPMSVQAMKEGAVDFLPKPVDNDVLLQTVHQAIERHAVEQSELAQVREFSARVERLTAREREVLQLVVNGKLNKQIAMELGISLVTVKVHRGRVMTKTEVESLAELVRLWERSGLGR